MSYYSELNRMYTFLDQLLKKGEITQNRLLLILTSKYEVSKKAIVERLELLEAEGYIEIKNGTIRSL